MGDDVVRDPGCRLEVRAIRLPREAFGSELVSAQLGNRTRFRRRAGRSAGTAPPSRTAVVRPHRS